MKLRTGEMFGHPASLILVTCNAMVRRDGRLVMGRGAAKEATQRYPGCDQQFGSLVLSHNRKLVISETKPYGVLVLLEKFTYSRSALGIFQVKWHWQNDASPDLIRYSVEKLEEIALVYDTVSLNFPGIGNGRLKREDVLPLLAPLPDNVTVWEK